MTAVIKVLTLYLINFLVAQRILPQELIESLMGNADAMLAIEMAVAAAFTVLLSFFAGLLKLVPHVLERVTQWVKNKLGVRE